MLARVERALVSLEEEAAAAAAAAVAVGGSAGGGMSIGRAQPLQLSANLAPGDLGVIDVQSWLHDDAEQRQCDGLMQESDHRRYAEYAELLDYAGLLGIDPVTESGLLWVAREAMEAPVPAGWHEARDPAGNPYYYYYKQPPPQSPPTAAARHAPPPPPSSAPQWSHPHDAYFRRVLRRARQATAAVAARAVGRVGPFLACLACIGWRRRASGVSCTARPIGGGGGGTIRPACWLRAGRRCTDREGLLLPRGERAQPVAASVEAYGAPACVATPGPTRGVDRAGPASRCASCELWRPILPPAQLLLRRRRGASGRPSGRALRLPQHTEDDRRRARGVARLGWPQMVGDGGGSVLRSDPIDRRPSPRDRGTRCGGVRRRGFCRAARPVRRGRCTLQPGGRQATDHACDLHHLSQHDKLVCGSRWPICAPASADGDLCQHLPAPHRRCLSVAKL
eukprot:SAG25_NODE_1651_length_2611_cov_3.039013_2_plen_452_part_00